MAVYPSNIRSFNTKIDLQDTVFALHINDLQDEMSAVQGELGVLPRGTFANVRARLDGVDTGKAATGHGHANLLDTPSHDVIARHVFGSALGNPGAPSTLVIGGSAVVGSGPAAAHEDHQHAMPSAAAFGSAALPAGTIVAYGGTTLPPGWLWCDGASYVRTSPYDALFNATGVRYGLGTNSPANTTFAVPNLGGRFPMGQATTNAAVVTAGTRDAVIVTHAHPGSGVSNGTADHQHYVDHQHSQGDAGGHVHTVVPPDYGDRMCFTSGGAQNDWLVNVNASNRGVGITFSHIYPGDGNHNHGWVSAMIGRQYTDGATNTGATHGHGLTIATQGVSATDANLPPYQTVNYIIKY